MGLAAEPRTEVLDELDGAMTIMRNADGPRTFVEGAERFRDVVIAAYAGPRLTATIRSSRSFMPWNFWAELEDNKSRLLPMLEVEYAAILRKDPAGARRACVDRADVMADLLIADLDRRGVFAELDS